MRKLITIALCLMAGQAMGASCMISEYRDVLDPSTPVATEPAIDTQEVTYTTSTQSAPFNSSTRFIRIICDAKAHFEVGTSPTAAVSDPYLAQDTAEYFGVDPGNRIAFYDGTS